MSVIADAHTNTHTTSVCACVHIHKFVWLRNTCWKENMYVLHKQKQIIFFYFFTFHRAYLFHNSFNCNAYLFCFFFFRFFNLFLLQNPFEALTDALTHWKFLSNVNHRCEQEPFYRLNGKRYKKNHTHTNTDTN